MKKRAMKRLFMILMLPLLWLPVSCTSDKEGAYPFDGVWKFIRVEVPPERVRPEMVWRIEQNKIYVGGYFEGTLEAEGDAWFLRVHNADEARLKIRFPTRSRMEIPDLNGNVAFYQRMTFGKDDKYPWDGVWQLGGFTFSGRMSEYEIRNPEDLVLRKHTLPGRRKAMIHEIDGKYFTSDPITGENIPLTLEVSGNRLLLKYRISNPILPYDGYNMVYEKNTADPAATEEKR